MKRKLITAFAMSQVAVYLMCAFAFWDINWAHHIPDASSDERLLGLAMWLAASYLLSFFSFIAIGGMKE